MLRNKYSGSNDDFSLNEGSVLPAWYEKVEDIRYATSKVETKMEELELLHRKLLRPNFVDKSEDEILMEQLGTEISKLISIAHKNICLVRSHQNSSQSPLERKLIGNVVRSLTTILQDQTSSFRNEQNAYLKQINSLQEYTNDVFDSFLGGQGSKTSVDTFDNFLAIKSFPLGNASQLDDLENDEKLLDEHFQMKPNIKFDQHQLLQYEMVNTKMVEAREKDVMGIVTSIVNLNQIFKELSHSVEDQGSILDRIDFNVEATQTNVSEGYQQLQKADRYQRASRKMYCIFILSCVTLFMLILLIITKL